MIKTIFAVKFIDNFKSFLQSFLLTQLRVAQRPDEAQTTAQDPNDERHPHGARALEHPFGRHEDPRPDDDPHDDGHSVQEPQLLPQLDAATLQGENSKRASVLTSLWTQNEEPKKYSWRKIESRILSSMFTFHVILILPII